MIVKETSERRRNVRGFFIPKYFILMFTNIFVYSRVIIYIAFNKNYTAKYYKGFVQCLGCLFFKSATFIENYIFCIPNPY